MPPRSRNSPAAFARSQIAITAARLMAEDGIADYALAKRKAARQMGLPDGAPLPTNDEVDSELRAYQAIYQEEELAERLVLLRHTAVEVMRELSDYTPYLIGPVLEGTAGRAAEVDLQLFADSAKEVEIHLLNRGFNFEHLSTRGERMEALLQLDWGGIPVNLAIFPLVAERTPSRGHSGKALARGRLAAVEALLASP